ncbi:hypothetical protein A9Q73_11210 [Bermanella sp. 47_1433_sub80_T6]|nr:hypothetical protein A9Q73_11210 [Bermanella sp. 47_1433_sub80_T6]
MFNPFLKVCFKTLKPQVFTFKINRLEAKSHCLIEVAHSTHLRLKHNRYLQLILPYNKGVKKQAMSNI